MTRPKTEVLYLPCCASPFLFESKLQTDIEPTPAATESRQEAIIPRPHAPRPFAKAEREARPQRGLFAASCLIPAMAAARPHGALHILLQARVVFALHVGAQVHR